LKFWNEQLLKDLADKALEMNKRFCGSRAISASFTVSYKINPPQINIYSPYYWAVYYKNGVDFIRFPKRGEWLIWYVNPNDDPRIRPVPQGYPIRRTDVRHLNRAEYREAKKLAKEGKVIFARSAGYIPAHDWTPKTFLFWTIYARIRIQQEMKKQIDNIFNPLKNLRIGS